MAIMLIQDMGEESMEEMRTLVETSSHGDLLPYARSESISSSHTIGSNG